MPLLERALTAFRAEDLSAEEGIRWLWLASATALDVWDDETWAMLSARHVQLARDAGALTVLPLALTSRVLVHLFAGELAAAALLVDEVDAIIEATGSRLAPYGRLLLLAWQGREPEASEVIEAATREAEARGEGLGLTVIQWTTAVLCNALGRYDDALAAARQAWECPDELGLATRVLPELIEAAVRSGTPEQAGDALKRLSEATRAANTDWALGIEARSRALLSDGQVAEDLYHEAIDRLGRSLAAVWLGRTHLLYGEWLRRERRRLDARTQLRTAHDLFTTMGLEAFAQRTARELRATGETARKRATETSDQLTAQETQIARLARDGLSNPEIGSQLFISPRTVEYHLHKVFTKLDINSRSQLDGALTSHSD
jgi:DNA-binding CsgD family transcriptional regulator